MNDIIVLFRHRDSSFYRDLFASSRQLKINERVSTRQERSTYCGKVTGTIAVRNNVSSGRDCLRHISARLSDNKAAAPVFVHAISKMHRERRSISTARTKYPVDPAPSNDIPPALRFFFFFLP